MPSEESLFQKIKRMWKTSRESKKTNSILLYLTCLLISFFFWLFLSLNSETQKDLSIPFNLSSLPDSTTIISGLPKSIDVSVRDKGSSLLKFDLGNIFDRSHIEDLPGLWDWVPKRLLFGRALVH